MAPEHFFEWGETMGAPKTKPGDPNQRHSQDLLMGEEFTINGERVSASLKRESEGGALSGVQGQSPWSGDQGDEVPLKLKTFSK